jgi:hypothetical protein
MKATEKPAQSIEKSYLRGFIAVDEAPLSSRETFSTWGAVRPWIWRCIASRVKARFVIWPVACMTIPKSIQCWGFSSPRQKLSRKRWRAATALGSNPQGRTRPMPLGLSEQVPAKAVFLTDGASAKNAKFGSSDWLAPVLRWRV